MKTLVIISDLHCGSVHGLCPPGWTNEKSPYYKSQKESWNAYKKMFHDWFRPDILLVNGDCIEGRQDRQGGAELMTNDRNIQAEIAEYCIAMWKAKNILMTYGTDYHTGSQAEDFEHTIARNLGARIGGRLFFKVEGLMIQARHKVGTSTIPHGRATALLKELMWALIREAQDGWPKVDILIRSHAHYNLWVEQPGKVALITPSLQLARGRYGSRQLSGNIHWGAIRLTLHKGQIVGRDIVCQDLIGNRPRVIRSFK